MGLTEGHWFEDEESLTERQLERAAEDEKAAYERGLMDGRNESARHGRWIKVHGYITPGGDPVWKCSECGKGIHVYGIEHGSYGSDIADGQWVACPNCGAKMDFEENMR